jgi:hypothetical protein
MTRAEQAALLRDRGNPYRNLIAAILYRAVLDVRSSILTWNTGGADPRCTRVAAIAYLRGCQDLTDLCALVDCDSDRVQPALLKAAGLDAVDLADRIVGKPVA